VEDRKGEKKDREKSADNRSSERRGGKRRRHCDDDDDHWTGGAESADWRHRGGGDGGVVPFGNPGYGNGPYGGGWVPFFQAHPDHWGSDSRHDRGGSYRSFGGREDRERRSSPPRRPQWLPGYGKNPDLEAERMTGAPLARVYSQHDDRRSGNSPPPRRRAPSPGGAWRHDMFEELVKK